MRPRSNCRGALQSPFTVAVMLENVPFNNLNVPIKDRISISDCLFYVYTSFRMISQERSKLVSPTVIYLKHLTDIILRENEK